MRSSSLLVVMALGCVACAGASDGAVPVTGESGSTATARTTTVDLFSDESVTDEAIELSATTTTSSTTTTTTTTIAPTTLPPTTTTVATATTTTTAPTTTLAATAPSQPAPTPTIAAGVSPCPPTGSSIWENRAASDIAPPALPDGWRTDSAGTSAAGRDLALLVREIENPTRTVMVIGGIHGNEPASPPSVRAMVTASIPDDTEVWLLPLLNPDGSAAGTRCNANGVDLNRNFSWDWRPSTGGPAPFSEPEPRAARSLIERVEPDVVVWVHQPLGYVSSIGNTPDAYEQAWAASSGLPVRRDVTQHGGGESWTSFAAGLPSMLIEIDSWDARPDIVDAQVNGFDALLDVVVPR
ncbi:MAG: M14 family zinc carboxypeptidase [Ilumatobacter sp.]